MLIEGFLVLIVVGIGSSFLLAGLAVLKGVVSELWKRWGAFFEALASRNWATTLGKVERAVVTAAHSGRGGAVYTPTVRYSYSVDGGSLVSERFAFYVATGIGDEGKTATQAVVERFRTGSSVEVHYDPKKPKRATLDRSLPPVMGATVGWLFVLFLAGPLFFYLGFIIVRGPFEDPPNLGETPPLIAQAGGFAVGIGVVLLLVAGVRAIRREEIRQRRMLRYLESAKPVLVHEVHEGELVAISGRVEELEFELDSEEEAALEVSRSDLQLPFEDGRLVHYDIDCEWYRTTAFSSFGVRDASGVALVELSEMESTFVQKRHLPVEGAVQRYLDEKREDSAAPIPAVPTEVTFQCIKKGDPVLVVGRAEDGDEFRATEGDPRTLLVASGTREEVVARLRKGLRWTRALLLLGGALIIAGAVAILV